MLLSSLFFLLISQVIVFVSCVPDIKFVVFRTETESPEQIAMLPRIQAAAKIYGDNKIEEYILPAGNTYKSKSDETLQSTWYKMEITREIMALNPQIAWVLTFELSALPTDGSAAVDFASLITQNPSIAVFLKRTNIGFGVAMYKNDMATGAVVDSIWGKRSAGGSLGAAYTNYAFWNPLILMKIKFL